MRALKRQQRLVGTRLRQLRKDKSQSQIHAAELVGIHPNHLGAIERGEVNVSLGVLVAFAKAYGVHVRDLFDESAKNPVSKKGTEVGAKARR